jgi:protein-S-isoprenylcysteine O-methyltransferase Ste14
MTSKDGSATLDAALVRRMLKQMLIWTVALAAVLFIAAGTLAWPEAWVYIVGSAILSLASGLTIASRNPELLRERMRGPMQEDQKSWDKPLIGVIIALCLLLPVAAGIDAVRLHLSHMPIWLEVMGGLFVCLGIYLFHVVMVTNTYATTVVRVQRERGHQVISTGPYAYVRHPMYTGASFYFLGIALLLGSWWAVAIAVLLIVLFAVRAVWEEETLKSELQGYAAYAERVRFRLVPWIW